MDWAGFWDGVDKADKVLSILENLSIVGGVIWLYRHFRDKGIKKKIDQLQHSHKSNGGDSDGE